MNSTRIIILLTLLSLVGFSVRGQNYNFQVYSLEKGLPQSEVRVITDDHLGYLWIGTIGGGVCRFNGKSFDVFNRRNGLPDNVVFSMLQDRKKNMWVLTTRGIARFDGLEFKTIVHADSTLFTPDTRMVVTSNGRIWFMANFGSGRRLFFIENDSLVDAQTVYGELLKGNTLYFLNSWSKNRAILTTKNGIFLLDGNELLPDDLNKRIDTRNQLVFQLIEDRQNCVWMAVLGQNGEVDIKRLHTNGEFEEVALPPGVDKRKLLGLYEDREGGLWTSVAQKGIMYHKGSSAVLFSPDNGLPSSLIHTVFQDNEGNFWLGSSGDGLIRYTNNFFTLLNEASGLTDNLIMRLFEASDGTKYFSDGSGGINVFDGQKVKAYPSDEVPDLGVVTGFAEDKNGILLASGSGLWRLNNGRIDRVNDRYGISGEPLLSLLQRKDTLWVGTVFSGIRKVVRGKVVETIDVQKSGIVSNAVQYMYFDRKGNLWVGTVIGLSKISPSGTVTNFTEKDGLKGLNVMQITEDRYGNIWFATFTGGLHRYDGKEFVVFDSTNGLKTDIVYSVLADWNGHIWSGSQLGVEQLEIGADGSVRKINRFDRFDGFTGVENNASAAICDQKGVLWFGTINGVVRCLPGERSTNHMPPPVYLREVQLNGKPVEWQQEPYRQYYDSLMPWLKIPLGLALPPRYTQIRFVFDALCYTQPEKVQYRYRLEPLDAEFSEPQSENAIAFSALPPGNYVLHIQAANNDGVWNEEGVTFAFQIEFLWWQSAWIKWIIIVLLIGVLVFMSWKMYRRKVRHQQELETLSLGKQLEINKLKSSVGEALQESKAIRGQIAQSKVKLNEMVQFLQSINQLLSSPADKLTEEKWMSQLYSCIDKAFGPHLFAFVQFQPAKEVVVFQYAWQKGERLPVFSYPADDLRRLVVKALLTREELWVADFEMDRERLGVDVRPVPGGFQAQSIWVAPVGKNALLTLQYEQKEALDDGSIQILSLVARAIGQVLS